MRAVVILTLALTLAGGCRRSEPGSAGPAGTNAPQATGNGGIIADLTGKTAVDAGMRAKATIERVSRQERRELEEAMQP
jgi:hypothetical protein